MFQMFDKSSVPNRASWMALLSRAPQHLLNTALLEHATVPIEWLRKPETGLMMVQARAGGTGERFNLGEVTVTRCALRLHTTDNDAPVGVSYVLGRNHQHAQLAAMADALLQDPAHHASLEISLLAPMRAHLKEQQIAQHERAQSTRVDFMTLAREAGGEDEGDEV